MSDELRDFRRRYERLRLLYEFSTRVHSTLDAEEALGLVVREAVVALRASSGSLALLNPTNGLLEIEASHGLPSGAEELVLRVGEGITGWVARTGRRARVGDVEADDRYVMIRPDVRSELAVPLEIDGETRGVLNVDSDRLQAFTEEDEQLLAELADHAVRVIRHTWLHGQVGLKARLFESLVNVSRAINSAMSMDEALRVITRQACVLMQTRMCSLQLLDPSGEWLELRASHGAGEAYRRKPRLSVAESLLGSVVRRRKPLQVEDVRVSAGYQSVQLAREEGLVSLLSVPLVFGGRSLGTLSVYTGKRHSFSNEEIRILLAMADLSALAIEKARLYERVVDIEEQLRQDERLSALGLLAAEVAHEIRNPLTVMKMLFHSLDLRYPEDDPRARDAALIREKMEQLDRIVDRILGYARSREPEMRPVDVNPLIGDLGLLVRHKLRNQGIDWSLELAERLPRVLGDATQLEQAFLNLVLNAVEAMPAGGVLRIRTRVQAVGRGAVNGAGADKLAGGGGERVLIEFEDTGPGLSEEVRARLFKSILTSTKARGTGLGLAIVMKTVEAHRGGIDVRSELGQGACFAVWLPAAESL